MYESFLGIVEEQSVLPNRKGDKAILIYLLRLID